jgi:GNAT superfamily N-acetyltransferase
MIDIRPAERADAPAIADLNVRTWRSSFDGIVPTAVLEAQETAPRERYFTEHLPSAPPFHTAVAVEDGVVIGFVHIGPSRDEDTGGDPEVYGLYVEPTRQRGGVGTMLMRHALDHLGAAAPGRATLWTLRDAPATRRFYERLGWMPDGTAKSPVVAGHRLPQVRYRYQGEDPGR